MKVQNNVAIYIGTIIEDDVFLGPSCVLTNVTNPRSQVNRHSLYEKTLLRRGCTIGANATIVCGITIGRYVFIAAGSVIDPMIILRQAQDKSFDKLRTGFDLTSSQVLPALMGKLHDAKIAGKDQVVICP